MKETKVSAKSRLVLRNATLKDIPDILNLSNKIYKGLEEYQYDVLRGQISNYQEGCFVILLDGKLVAYSASIILPEAKALAPHRWKEITGGGFGVTHDPDGEVLYGYETFVDPEVRGQRLARRIYNARIKLVKFQKLKGIIFCGRIPNYHKHAKKIPDVNKYVELVRNKKIKDSVLGFQLRNGFEVLGVFENYMPSDRQSLGYGIHLKWENTEYTSAESKKKQGLRPKSVRVVTVQYKLRALESFEEFAKIAEYYVDVAGDYKADFLLFPELFTMQLLSIKNEEVAPDVAIEHMTEYTERIRDLFRQFAIKYNVNIIAGSHPTRVDGQVQNISFVCLRDGSVHVQAKIHPTPDERYWWKIQGGDSVKVIETDCGPIGVLVCYDSEFPELCRHLVNQGMYFLFVPFLTDNRQAYCRVRYSCQARAVENQIYVAMAGNVGNLPRVKNIDIQYAQSCILTPCDFPFAKDGIAAETDANVESVAIADLRVDTLLEARASGAVRNLRDRRHDLYSVVWHKK